MAKARDHFQYLWDHASSPERETLCSLACATRSIGNNLVALTDRGYVADGALAVSGAGLVEFVKERCAAQPRPREASSPVPCHPGTSSRIQLPQVPLDPTAPELRLALLVGVNRYKHEKTRSYGLPPLRYAEPDAELLADSLEKDLLFLAANALETVPFVPLAYGLEWEELRRSLTLAGQALRIEAVSRFAVSPNTLLDAVTEERPTIVHFSGHCETDGRIALESRDGKPVYLPMDRLCRIIRAVRPVNPVRLVCLNVCHAAAAAEPLTREVDAVVGSPHAVPDELALEFVRRFYFSLARDLPLASALEYGLMQVEDYCEQHPNMAEYIRGMMVAGRRLTPRELFVALHRPEVKLEELYMGRMGR
jgi:hypothetical protein